MRVKQTAVKVASLQKRLAGLEVSAKETLLETVQRRFAGLEVSLNTRGGANILDENAPLPERVYISDVFLPTDFDVPLIVVGVDDNNRALMMQVEDGTIPMAITSLVDGGCLEHFGAVIDRLPGITIEIPRLDPFIKQHFGDLGEEFHVKYEDCSLLVFKKGHAEPLEVLLESDEGDLILPPVIVEPSAAVIKAFVKGARKRPTCSLCKKKGITILRKGHICPNKNS